jgi:hypothetical protein
MRPYIQVHEGEQFLTFASDLESAQSAFRDHGLPEGRAREQPYRKAAEFVYTHRERGSVPATLLGEAYDPDAITVVNPRPAARGTYDPKLVEITIGKSPNDG